MFARFFLIPLFFSFGINNGESFNRIFSWLDVFHGGFNIDRRLSNVDDANEENYNHAIIIDAGSTGSRVHVYRYINDPNSPLVSIDFKNEKYQKFYPGLSSFEDKYDNLTAMKQYMTPLIEYARQYVPLSQRARTPFYMLATAGLRKVREKNENIALSIMNLVYQYLAQYTEFIVEKSHVRIIEGKDEGLWSWIAANYLNGEIQKSVETGSPFNANTKGVLEMGGESLQITFVPNEHHISSQIISSQYLQYVTIGDVMFPIFTHSYMGIGMQAAQTKFDFYLTQNVNFNSNNHGDGDNSNTDNNRNYETPCYIKGITRDYSYYSIIENQENNNNNDNVKQIFWNGNGNFRECYDHLKKIIDVSDCNHDNNDGNIQSKELSLNSNNNNNNKIKVKTEDLICTPNGVSMPRLDNSKQFYYIENFYYTANVLKITENQANFYQSLLENGQKYCSLTREDAAKLYPHASEDEIKKTCFCAAWLAVILDEAFDLKDFNNYRVIRDINKVGIDWALGFLVINVNSIPQDQKLSSNMVFVSIVLILLIILCWYQYREGKCPTQVYKVRKSVIKMKEKMLNQNPKGYAKLHPYPAIGDQDLL